MNTILLDKIDELQASIDKHGVLDAELQKKINYRFRLDWNFFSNEMEGNSLTRIETRQLMMENVTVDGKPFKDVFEMQGHDKEVLEIMRIGKGEVRLSESRIKAMHRAIMYESDPEKEQFIGNWKPINNYLINYKGEKFEFLPPEEVADAMHHLLNQTNAGIDALKAAKKEAIHPVELAFQFHLEYIRIHPFYDGNGRTARLLTNLLLISTGFPPVILRKKDRDLYYKYLADIQGYGAHSDLFLDFMGELVVQSQELILDAINGKSLEDEDDLDKEIALWKNELDHESEGIKLSNVLIVNIYTHSIRQLFSLFLGKMKQFDDLFSTQELKLIINQNKHITPNCISKLNQIINIIDPLRNDLEFIVSEKFNLIKENIFTDSIYQIGIDYSLLSFAKDGLNTFNKNIQLFVKFSEHHYKVIYQIENQLFEIKTKLLSEKLTDLEIKEIVKEVVLQTFQSIRLLTNKNTP